MRASTSRPKPRHFTESVAPNWLLNPLARTNTGTCPLAEEGRRTMTCVGAGVRPGAPPAYRSSASWPPTTTITGGEKVGPAAATAPSGWRDAPAPIINKETMEPVAAGLDGEFRVSSKLIAAQDPVPEG